MIVGAYNRPDNWLWLLTFHLVGALTLVGAAITVSVLSIAAIRSTDEARVVDLRRLALRMNLMFALPAFVVAYLFGGALAGKEFGKGIEDPGWLGWAFGFTDLFGIFGIVVLTLLQWWVLRRARSGALAGWQAQVASWLSPVVLAMLFVVLFLMAGKPGQ